MAKKKANPNEDVQGDIIYDRMPGADAITKEDAEGFNVDMNFETVSEDEGVTDEEAETPQEDTLGDETNLETSPEELEAKEQGEAEPEAENSPEEVVEETMADADADATRSDDGGVEEEVAEEPVAKKDKAPMVPKSRLDEVLAKNKKMQKRINEIEQAEAAAKAEAPQYDFASKEQEYQQLLLDGEMNQAAVVRNEIRQAEKEAMMFEVQQQMGQTVQQNQEAQELQAKAQEIEQTFPILDQNSTTYDEGLTQEVMDLRDAFMVQGYGAADSLARATEYTLAAKRPELLSTAGDSSLQGNENVVTQEQVQERRQKTTVKKKVAAAKSQPPAMKGEGAGERGEKPVDIDVLSDDEFMALPEETLRRMRGDFG
jgi:hypothetical protein